MTYDIWASMKWPDPDDEHNSSMKAMALTHARDDELRRLYASGTKELIFAILSLFNMQEMVAMPSAMTLIQC